MSLLARAHTHTYVMYITEIEKENVHLFVSFVEEYRAQKLAMHSGALLHTFSHDNGMTMTHINNGCALLNLYFTLSAHIGRVKEKAKKRERERG